MQNFEVHSNESTSRKSGCLGLDQVIKQTHIMRFIELDQTNFIGGYLCIYIIIIVILSCRNYYFNTFFL